MVDVGWGDMKRTAMVVGNRKIGKIRSEMDGRKLEWGKGGRGGWMGKSSTRTMADLRESKAPCESVIS